MAPGENSASALDLRGQRVLLAGAGGFIGPRLTAALLARGASVEAVVRPGSVAGPLEKISGALRVHRCDLASSVAVGELLRRLRPTLVVNLARGRGEASAEQRRRLLRDTLFSAAELLESARNVGCERFVQLGSPTEYGPADVPLAEERRLEPRTALGAAKAAATELCLAADRGGGLRAAVLRPFVVYGPGERPERLISRAISAAREGRAVRLTGSDACRDWVYVDDVVEGCMLALDGRADGEAVNLATGVQTSNREVVDLVAATLGRPIQIDPEPEPARPWDAASWVGATQKASRLLDWRARTPLASGIAALAGEAEALPAADTGWAG